MDIINYDYQRSIMDPSQMKLFLAEKIRQLEGKPHPPVDLSQHQSCDLCRQQIEEEITHKSILCQCQPLIVHKECRSIYHGYWDKCYRCKQKLLPLELSIRLIFHNNEDIRRRSSIISHVCNRITNSCDFGRTVSCYISRGDGSLAHYYRDKMGELNLEAKNVQKILDQW